MRGKTKHEIILERRRNTSKRQQKLLSTLFYKDIINNSRKFIEKVQE